MQRIRNLVATLMLGLSVSIASVAPVLVPTGIVALTATQTACGPNTLTKLHDTLNKTAKALNAAAKTNRSFYDAGIYGAVGSDAAIVVRQKGATAIHAANENLIIALNLAKGLTEETFAMGKLEVLKALADAAAGLHTGNVKLDLVLQGVATLINQAVILIEAFNARDLDQVLPVIRTWEIKKLEEVSA